MKVRLPMVFAVAALLLLAALVAWGRSGIPATPSVSAPETYTPTPIEGTPTTMPQPGSDPMDSTVTTIILLVIMVVLVVAALLSVLTAGLRLRRHRRAQVLDDVTEAEPGWLTEATRKAMSEMDRRTGGPPSDAVIAAWVQLEQSAAASGTEREPHQTPSEFTEAVLTRHNADAAALQQLRSVYHRARFGEPGQVTGGDAVAARQALERIALEAK